MIVAVSSVVEPFGARGLYSAVDPRGVEDALFNLHLGCGRVGPVHANLKLAGPCVGDPGREPQTLLTVRGVLDAEVGQRRRPEVWQDVRGCRGWGGRHEAR